MLGAQPAGRAGLPVLEEPQGKPLKENARGRRADGEEGEGGLHIRDLTHEGGEKINVEKSMDIQNKSKVYLI